MLYSQITLALVLGLGALAPADALTVGGRAPHRAARLTAAPRMVAEPPTFTSESAKCAARPPARPPARARAAAADDDDGPRAAPRAGSRLATTPSSTRT
jgi:hypothetical protein